MIFKYSQYKEFLFEAKKLGPVCTLASWDGSNAILLRHDIDIDVRAAFNLAMVEKECGVRSTLYFMTTCETYNVFSPVNAELIRKLSDTGFEIGLHFDPTYYPNLSEEELPAQVQREAKILEFVSGKEIRSISLHNPSVHGRFPMFPGFNNAYDSRIFSPDNYIADSRMDFRGKNPFEFVKKVESGPVQVLLHPIHFTESGSDYPEIMSAVARRFIDGLHTLVLPNSTYASQMKNESLLNFFKNQD